MSDNIPLVVAAATIALFAILEEQKLQQIITHTLLKRKLKKRDLRGKKKENFPRNE